MHLAVKVVRAECQLVCKLSRSNMQAMLLIDNVNRYYWDNISIVLLNIAVGEGSAYDIIKKWAASSFTNTKQDSTNNNMLFLRGSRFVVSPGHDCTDWNVSWFFHSSFCQNNTTDFVVTTSIFFPIHSLTIILHSLRY